MIRIIKILDSKDKFLLFFGGVFIAGLVLIPTALVEFRYFTLPLLFLNFEIKPNPNKNSEKTISYFGQVFHDLSLNMLIYSAINLVLFYVFIFRPFPCFAGPNCRFLW